MTTGCGAALQLDASSTQAHYRWWQIGQRGRGRVLSLSPSHSLCFPNKTLTSTPWLPPLCLTSGHNTETSASNRDCSVKATQMAWRHPSSGPVTQSLLYFSTKTLWLSILHTCFNSSLIHVCSQTCRNTLCGKKYKKLQPHTKNSRLTAGLSKFPSTLTKYSSVCSNKGN